jgi:hypothetical protein
MMLKRLFGLKFLLVTLVFLCVWLWRVSSWQNSFRLPTVEEFVRDFILLPVLLCVALWLLKSAALQINSKGTPAVATNSDESGSKKSASIGYLEIRDVEFRLPIGGSPQAIIRAMMQRVQPGFHDALKTADGGPARLAWVDNLTADDFVSLAPEGVNSLACEVKRALLLASEVLQAVATRHSERGDASTDLQIHYLSPARWGVITTNTAEQWLVDRLATWQMPSMRLQIGVHPVPSALDALVYLNELNTRINKDRDDTAHVLLISDSFIGNGLVEQWDKQSRLLGIDRPECGIPGEGACALLLARPSGTQSNHPFARVSKVDIRQCNSLVNPPDNQISGLIEEQGGVAFEVGAVISDANHWASRQGEVAEMLHNFFPGLHPVDDSFALSVGCGEMAAVTPIAALALAAHQSVCLQKSILVVSVQDDARKAVLLVHPPSEEVQSALKESV